MINRRLILPLFFLLFNITTVTKAQIKQIGLPRVDEMADLPQPLQIINWKNMAVRFDSTVYDLNAKGKYWPMVWIDNTGKNFKQPTLGIYTAIGDVRQGPNNNKACSMKH